MSASTPEFPPVAILYQAVPAPEIDGMVFVEGQAPIGEIVPVRITGAMAYDRQATDDALSIDANLKYLEENKVKKGVITRPSGLQFRIIQNGFGKRPQSTDEVKRLSTWRRNSRCSMSRSLASAEPSDPYPRSRRWRACSTAWAASGSA